MLYFVLCWLLLLRDSKYTKKEFFFTKSTPQNIISTDFSLSVVISDGFQFDTSILNVFVALI